MRIYVVGFMGAGKTTIGRELARRLEIPFFDLDELVESAEGMSIKDIFGDKGEPFFRKRERDLLRTTRWIEHGVIATGGGTFTFEDNIQFIRSEGLSIHLSAPFSLLRSRIGEKAAERPMFRDDVATHELYQQRLKFYALSDLTLDLREEESIREAVGRLLLMLPPAARQGPGRRAG
ncbi:MAG TPA: shikimate kinase [Thermoanaerobaculia bacterium]|nr:shikimate kinase [Thermoanaerobaculia bacterium]